MAGQPPPGAPPHHGGGKFMAWVKSHKAIAIAGGAGLGLGALYLVQKGQASAGASGSTSGTAGTAGADPGVYAGDGSGGYDPYANEMAELQNYLTAYQDGTLGGQLGITSGGGGTGTKKKTPPPKKKAPPPKKKAPPPKKKAPPPKKTKPFPKLGKPGSKAPRPGFITVQKGQTLTSLSERYFGTGNRTQLAHMNHLGTGAGLRTGQRLKI